MAQALPPETDMPFVRSSIAQERSVSREEKSLILKDNCKEKVLLRLLFLQRH